VQLDGVPQGSQPALWWFRLPPRKRLFEGGDIQPAGRIRPPLERVRRHVEEAVWLRESVAEVVKHMAQVRACLRLGRVGPEQEGEMLSRLRGGAVEQEVSEE